MAMHPEQDDRAIEQAANTAAAGLRSGRPRASVVQDLVENGWAEPEAQEFVLSVETAMQENPTDGGNGGGAASWAAWIAGLLIFNALSYAFDWGWIIW